MVVLFAIDLEHHLLPNVDHASGDRRRPDRQLRAAAGHASTRSSASLVGGGVLWLIGEAYYRYSGQEGMGGGDVKMLAMIGAFLGWKLVLVTLVLSSVAGSRHRAPRHRARKGGMKYALPYGTFLALGAPGRVARRRSHRDLVCGFYVLYDVPGSVRSRDAGQLRDRDAESRDIDDRVAQ